MNEGISQIQSIRNQIGDDSVPLTTEVKTSKIYFREFSKVIPERYDFESRNQSFLRGTKNHATNVINALLNYGYAVLAGEISKFINGVGLDSYYGFYHESHTGFQPLVYDMIEPFRWLVEYSVYKMANLHNYDHTIRTKDFTWTREGKVVMDSDLIRRFLEILERKFLSERPYKFGHGMKTSDGLKSCQEITIAKIIVQNLADFCIVKRSSFEG